ncbi:unnamed protein product, partial [Darwinula stevensoni]
MANSGQKFEEGRREREEVLRLAKDFIDNFYADIGMSETAAQRDRSAAIELQVTSTGTYDLTSDELAFGARNAWRNASRCIGRIHWPPLKRKTAPQVFDARGATTTAGMFQAICDHIKYGTNGGKI